MSVDKSFAESKLFGHGIADTDADLILKLSHDPADARLLTMMAEYWHKKGDSHVAARFEAMACLFRSGLESHISTIADLLIASKKFEEAIELLCHQSRIASAEENVCCLIATCYRGLGDFANAEKQLRYALSLNSRLAPAWAQLGLILLSSGRASEAIDAFSKATEAEDSAEENWCNLGAAYLANRQWSESLVPLQKALAIRPGYVDAMANLGLAWTLLEQPQKALLYLSDVLRLAPDHSNARSYHKMAVGRLRDKSTRQKEGDDAQVEEMSREKASRFFKEGNDSYNEKKYDEAIEKYSSCLELDPKHPLAVGNTGLAHLAMERYAEAVQFLSRAVERNPVDANMWTQLGNAFKGLEEHDKAIAAHKSAIAISPFHAEAFTNLGVAYANADMFDEALEAYRMALRYNPKLVRAYSNLGNAQLSLNRIDESIESYEKALAIDPEHEDSNLHSSLALLIAGRYREGWSRYEWRGKKIDFHGQGERWDGRPISSGKLLIIREQGIGDAVNFVRFLKPLRDKLQEWEPQRFFSNRHQRQFRFLRIRDIKAWLKSGM